MKILKSLFFIGLGVGVATLFPTETADAIEYVKTFDFKAGVEGAVEVVKSTIDWAVGMFSGSEDMVMEVKS